jgi:CBS domain containing-hemolysin-like protein
MLDNGFELTLMAALAVLSAFFSSSEAALFSLSRSDRTAMATGTPGERRAAGLLKRPERLLTAVLFCNLTINLVNYALAEIVSVRMGEGEGAAGWTRTLFSVGTLVAIILFCEVLPKSIAVLRPRLVGSLVSAPLGLATRAVDPVLKPLQTVSNALARLLLPSLEAEPYLELGDLERAVEIQAGDPLDSDAMRLKERQVLQRVVELADITAAELMRPRRRCLVVRPPVRLDDLRGRLDGVGEYVLVTEPHSEEIASALAINRLALLPPDRMESRAERVVAVPWCAPASQTLQRLREDGRRVAVVVNELGETIGIVPIERLLDAVLGDTVQLDPHDAHGSRLVQLNANAWEASSAAPLSRVVKRLSDWLEAANNQAAAEALVEAVDEARSRTVGGLFQEALERMPRLGEQITVGGLLWTVTAGDAELDPNQALTIRIARPQPDETDGRPEASDHHELGGAI